MMAGTEFSRNAAAAAGAGWRRGRGGDGTVGAGDEAGGWGAVVGCPQEREVVHGGVVGTGGLTQLQTNCIIETRI